MDKKQTSQIPNILLSVKDASAAISVSTKTVRSLIASGRLKAVNLGQRMTRISLQELTDFAEQQGCQVQVSSSLPLYNYNKDRKAAPVPVCVAETGRVNKTAKCRRTPASEKAPDGVTHETHYTMAEVLSKFRIKYGRLYEIRNRYQLQSVHAWGTTCFKKADVEDVVSKYNEEQGRAQAESYYTCFDIMQKFGLGKTQVRRFAETHGVRIRKAKGGRANLYLKADWDAARKKAEAVSVCTKGKRV